MRRIYAKSGHHARRLHPLPVRIMHWINAVAILIMISSGWKIYNDDVIFGWLHFPESLTLGRWAQNGLQWHFFGMWIVASTGWLTSPMVSLLGAFAECFCRFACAIC